MAVDTSDQVAAMMSNVASLAGKTPLTVTKEDAFECYLEPLIEDVHTKLSAVYNRAPDGTVAPPTRRDALLCVWVIFVTMLHGRTVIDVEGSPARAKKVAAGRADTGVKVDPVPLFGGMPTAADGHSRARHNQVAALLRETRHEHTACHTDAGQVGSDVVLSNLLARVAMGPPGTSGWLSRCRTTTTRRTSGRPTPTSMVLRACWCKSAG